MSLRRAELAVGLVALAVAVIVGVTRFRRDAEDHATDYVSHEPGTLPVVLVVPHDGDLWRPSVPPRSVTPRRDEHTHDVAEAIAQALLERTGKRPHIVNLLLDRRQLDVNRAPEDAYEHEGARQVYEAFHARVGRVSRACGGDWCLLLDLHGNWKFPADLYLGTDGGRTIRAGEGRSIERRLREAARASGFDAADRTTTPATLQGDFITSQFGRPRTTATEAVMVELHERVRNDPVARERMAAAIADAIMGYLEAGEAE